MKTKINAPPAILRSINWWFVFSSKLQRHWFLHIQNLRMRVAAIDSSFWNDNHYCITPGHCTRLAHSHSVAKYIWCEAQWSKWLQLDCSYQVFHLGLAFVKDKISESMMTGENCRWIRDHLLLPAQFLPCFTNQAAINGRQSIEFEVYEVIRLVCYKLNTWSNEANAYKEKECYSPWRTEGIRSLQRKTKGLIKMDTTPTKWSITSASKYNDFIKTVIKSSKNEKLMYRKDVFTAQCRQYKSSFMANEIVPTTVLFCCNDKLRKSDAQRIGN